MPPMMITTSIRPQTLRRNAVQRCAHVWRSIFA